MSSRGDHLVSSPSGERLREGVLEARPSAWERAGYFRQGRQQLYYVLHQSTAQPQAYAVLAGPFTAERSHSYIPWVRWARYLADHGVEALRFDYRGVGESTGRFEDMGFAAWIEDLKLCVDWMRHLAQGRGPVVVHGLGMGALLGASVFHQKCGDALLMWSAPASARKMMFDALRQRLAADFAAGHNQPPRQREDYIAQLEAGQSVEVEGYLWTPQLWAESARLALSLPADNSPHPDRDRPIKRVQLDQSAAPLSSGGGLWAARPRARVKQCPVNPDLSELFEENWRWIVGIAKERT